MMRFFRLSVVALSIMGAFTACGAYAYVERRYTDFEKIERPVDTVVETGVPLSLHTSPLGLLYHEVLTFPVDLIAYQNQLLHDDPVWQQCLYRPVHACLWLLLDIVHGAARTVAIPWAAWADLSAESDMRTGRLNAYRYNVVSAQFVDIDPTNPRLDARTGQDKAEAKNDRPDGR